MKRKEIKKQIEGWIADMESQSSDRRTGRTISLNTMALKVGLLVTNYSAVLKGFFNV